MKQHFVEFLSPGTFVSERTLKPIDEWDIDQAIEMSYGIVERYNARPFGFQFVTRERTESDLDSKETVRSPTYFLGGKVLSLNDIKERGNPDDAILISNMEGNGWDEVVENNNSFRSVHPVEVNDVVLDYVLPV